MTAPADNRLKELQDTALEHLWVYLREPSDMAEKGEPQIFVSGKGVHVTDATGRTYMDAMSGLWLKNVGYGQTEIARRSLPADAELVLHANGDHHRGHRAVGGKSGGHNPWGPVPLLLHQRRF